MEYNIFSNSEWSEERIHFKIFNYLFKDDALQPKRFDGFQQTRCHSILLIRYEDTVQYSSNAYKTVSIANRESCCVRTTAVVLCTDLKPSSKTSGKAPMKRREKVCTLAGRKMAKRKSGYQRFRRKKYAVNDGGKKLIKLSK